MYCLDSQACAEVELYAGRVAATDRLYPPFEPDVTDKGTQQILWWSWDHCLGHANRQLLSGNAIPRTKFGQISVARAREGSRSEVGRKLKRDTQTLFGDPVNPAKISPRRFKRGRPINQKRNPYITAMAKATNSFTITVLAHRRRIERKGYRQLRSGARPCRYATLHLPITYLHL